MMVVYMMGEFTLVPDEPRKRRRLLRLKYEILINPLADDWIGGKNWDATRVSVSTGNINGFSNDPQPRSRPGLQCTQ